MKQKVKSEHEKLCEMVAKKLSDARRVNLTADTWSKPGMTQNVLGLTVHFFTKSDNKRQRILLAIKEMSVPHTEKEILNTPTGS